VRAPRHEFVVPLRLLGIGLPLTIAAGTLAGAAVPDDDGERAGGRASAALGRGYCSCSVGRTRISLIATCRGRVTM
jgi:hypothetical protein